MEVDTRRKMEVEMEVDTRRKASVTLSAKMSAEFTQISDNCPQIFVNLKVGN